ncbi:hypothetical protein [Streptomyces sp. ME19-01-6]|nr:hypothetical protein [Streptomyces sp. ME19-01-6]MDX3227182.1 hypothetical protein [Streptomyces sp. ME19-01-6]
MSNAYSPIPELNLLKEFEDEFGASGYADGFELLDYDDKGDLVREQRRD